MRATFRRAAGGGVEAVRAALVEDAQRICAEDLAQCEAIARHGGALLPAQGRVLTHCNAGALCAAGGYGTALGVIRGAVELQKQVQVLATETRPYLQGARLTAWELHHDHIPVTLITDNMVGHMMKTSQVNCVVVGADRIAANGDTPTRSAPIPLRCWPASTTCPSTWPRLSARLTSRCPRARAFRLKSARRKKSPISVRRASPPRMCPRVTRPSTLRRHGDRCHRHRARRRPPALRAVLERVGRHGKLFHRIAST